MKVTILADSGALPRSPDWGGLRLEETYPYLLQKRWPSNHRSGPLYVMERGMRYRTSEDVLRDWYEMVTLRQPDAVIIQVGGADCAPRVLLPRERAWIKKQRWLPLSQRALDLENRYRRGYLLRFRPRVMVPIEQFRKNLSEILLRTVADRIQKLILLNIFYPAPKILNDFAGAEKLIDEYNAAIAEAVYHSDGSATLVDLHHLVKSQGGAEINTVDGLHLSPFLQNQLCAEIIGRLIESAAEGLSKPSPRPLVER